MFDDLGIRLGPFYLRYYGLILMSGALAAGWAAAVEAKRRGRNPDVVWDGIVWVLVAGIIGARLWHVLTPPESMVIPGCVITTTENCKLTAFWYLTHPFDALAVWRGGLGIVGGVAGGVLGLLIFTRRSKFKFVEWLDIAAPGLPLAQAIGRWGNFVNQELYGQPSTLPWAIHIDPAHRLPGLAGFETFHPLFLYESIYNLLASLGLMWIARRYAGRLKSGDLFIIYLILYSIIRFILEFFRIDSPLLVGWNINQTVVAVTALAGGAVLAVRHNYIQFRRPGRAQEA